MLPGASLNRIVSTDRQEQAMESPVLESAKLHQTATSTSEQPSKAGGLSPTRLARMHEVMLRHVGHGRLPGLVALISRRGVEHADVIGTLAFDRSAPMRRDTIFRLASVTKPITAVAAMILVEECKLRLDDPVDEFLPELANRKVLRTIDSEIDDTVPAKRPITTRDLLTYRSGYGEVAFLSPMCPLQKALFEARLPLSAWMFPGTPDQYMQRLGRLPLANQPGERWLYHMSAEILGVLISRVSGMSLSAFMRERIFEPLGMKDTGFTVPEAKLDRVATCYKTDFSSGEISVLEEARAENIAQQCAFESGAGDRCFSTADDLLAFGRMMLNQGAYGNARILSRPSVELMTTDHLTPEQKAASPFFENIWDSRGWGLGLSIVTRRVDLASVPGRFGWDGAFSTSFYVDPNENMVGILMAQCLPGALRLPPVVLDFWTSAYQAIDDRAGD
jgi:CubicO group peptidase (beta-lactamase class C family)